MQIAVLSGYRMPHRRSHRRGGSKMSMRKKMKSCARKHKVTSKGFWACVRGGKRRKSRR